MSARGDELLIKAREAMIAAVHTFNSASLQFRAEIFIVTAVIAWTYLMHAYYRREGVDYRYRRAGVIQTTPSGAEKYWELGQCVATGVRAIVVCRRGRCTDGVEPGAALLAGERLQFLDSFRLFEIVTEDRDVDVLREPVDVSPRPLRRSWLLTSIAYCCAYGRAQPEKGKRKRWDSADFRLRFLNIAIELANFIKPRHKRRLVSPIQKSFNNFP
ncbi:DUF3644 domain-containing protein [Sphingomonas sp. MS122]|uniref:DUF3644 domain-containing protein n=1 Tax=Sphingomonas sp. MS122 TaxID=3412683 RepID=UPI003C2EB49E